MLIPRAYFDLSFAGPKAHHRIAEEIEGSNCLHRPGVVQWKDAGSEAAGLGEGDFEKLGRLQD